MADLLVPGYQQVNLGVHGGVYDETKHPKGCIHTTEGSSLEGAEAAYRDYPPHIGYDPKRRIRHQYVPLNKHSYAFRGSESDDEFIIQIEIVGFASQTHTWPDNIYNNIAEDVIEPLEKHVGIPRTFLRFYGEDDGVILASTESPIRLSNSELRAYSGWLGHQHVPEPDTHWDPGKFLIAKCFKYLEGTGDDDMALTDKLPAVKMSDGKFYSLTVADVLHGLAPYIPGQGSAKAPLTNHPAGPYVSRILSLDRIKSDLQGAEDAIIKAIQDDVNDTVNIPELAEALKANLSAEFIEALAQQLAK